MIQLWLPGVFFFFLLASSLSDVEHDACFF